MEAKATRRKKAQLYLSGIVLSREKFFIKIVNANNKVSIAAKDAKFKLKFSLLKIGWSVKISRHGRINKRSIRPSFGLIKARAKIKNNKINNILKSIFMSAIKEKITEKIPASKTMIAILEFDII